MSENDQKPEIQTNIDISSLYREEAYSDLQAGGIKAFFPVDEKGIDVVDGSREPVFVAMTTIQDPSGQQFPIQATLEAKHLPEACEQFKPALDKIIKDLVKKSEEYEASQGIKTVEDSEESE